MEKDFERILKNKEKILIDKYESLLAEFKEAKTINQKLYQDNDTLKQSLDRL